MEDPEHVLKCLFLLHILFRYMPIDIGKQLKSCFVPAKTRGCIFIMVQHMIYFHYSMFCIARKVSSPFAISNSSTICDTLKKDTHKMWLQAIECARPSRIHSIRSIYYQMCQIVSLVISFDIS